MSTFDTHNERISNVISILTHANNNHISYSRAGVEKGFSEDYVTDFKRRHNVNNFSPKLYEEFTQKLIDYETLRQFRTKQQTPTESKNLNTDEKFDSRSTCGEDRNEHGQIISYWYKILVRDESPFCGKLSREQMETIYQNYPFVTQNTCSSYFQYLTFTQFKRIIRVFNITKEKLFPKHILEEHTEEEIAQFGLKAKEHSSYKKYVEQKPIFIEQKLREAQKELFDIKEDREFFTNIIEAYFQQRSIQKSIRLKTNEHDHKGQKTLFTIMGDIHFGKKFNKSVYGRGTNKDILKERLFQIANTIIGELQTNKYNKVQLLCLGDLIESILPEGMHPSHVFEMDLFGADQVIYTINAFEEFFDYLLINTDIDEIKFDGISGNHDRIGLKREEDKKRSAGKIIYAMLSKLYNSSDSRIIINNPDDEIISLYEDDISVIAHHGDASLMKRKPLDLINLFKKGKANSFTLLLNGHWHTTKIEEGINFLHLGVPSVCSTDNFIQYELGVGSQPGFIIGHRADAFGFDFKKVTLY
jgi:hypothetical protein